MTNLDEMIRSALTALGRNDFSGWNPNAYIDSFNSSARNKAREVIDLLKSDGHPFYGMSPVFVSIGGGDGAEVLHLLKETTATTAVLLEGNRHFADVARKNASELPPQKRLIVIEGDAQAKVAEVMRVACDAVSQASGEYVAVTCHAVIHELFDRSAIEFDPVGFFAEIFGDENVPIWFTYREPGVPTEWPDQVLVKADCSDEAIVQLANAILARHPQIVSKDRDRPRHVGGLVRMGRTLGMELLAKLFYLSDLGHEIEERSTAVNHSDLVQALFLAIGDSALDEKRGQALSMSAPTSSFVRCWESFRVDVWGIFEGVTKRQLPIAQSQTRVVAWRAKARSAASIAQDQQSQFEIDLSQEALDLRFDGLLQDLVYSKGRSWVESPNKTRAAQQFTKIIAEPSIGDFTRLWCHYLLSISELFETSTPEDDPFAETYLQIARSCELGTLFLAERMEFKRKANLLDEAILLSEQVIAAIEKCPPSVDHSPQQYSTGVACFLMNNLLRHGGRYDEAAKFLERAQSYFNPSVSSHATELAHCFYANSVCISMTGHGNEMNFDQVKDRDFANALAELSWLNAAWYLNDLDRAITHAGRAIQMFSSLGFRGYAERTRNVKLMVEWWQSLANGNPQSPDTLSGELQLISALTDTMSTDATHLLNVFKEMRPGIVISMLQFAKEFAPTLWSASAEIALPRVLEKRDGTFVWSELLQGNSLRDVDSILRKALGIEPDRRVPLLAH